MSVTTRPVDPGRDAVMRTLWTADSDETWNSRSAANKAMMVAREVSHRLGGLSTIAYGLSFAEIAKGGQHGKGALHSEHYYFATALKDAANQLAAAHAAWWDEESDPKPKARRKPNLGATT